MHELMTFCSFSFNFAYRKNTCHAYTVGGIKLFAESYQLLLKHTRVDQSNFDIIVTACVFRTGVQLIRFARACSNVDDFNNRNLFLTAKLLKQGYRYHRIRKAFSKFYHRHSELIVKCNKAYQNLYFMVI